MKIQIDTIPTRITTQFQREVCSRRKTNTYYYHKRKWNKKVTSNSKTGTKQTFTILTDEHVALVHSVCFGRSTLRIIMMVQCFAVLLILCIPGGSLGTTTSPQQQNTANLKDLCKVLNNYLFLLTFLGHFSGSQWKNIAWRKLAAKYILAQSKAPFSIAYRAPSGPYYFFSWC